MNTPETSDGAMTPERGSIHFLGPVAETHTISWASCSPGESRQPAVQIQGSQKAVVKLLSRKRTRDREFLLQEVGFSQAHCLIESC